MNTFFSTFFKGVSNTCFEVNRFINERSVVNAKISIAMGAISLFWGLYQYTNIHREWHNFRLVKAEAEEHHPHVIKAIVTAIAVAVIIFNSYKTISNFLELQMNESDFSFNSIDRINQTKMQLMECPAGKKLWDRVLQDGEFTIEYVDPEIVPFGAGVSTTTRAILLSNTEENVLTSLVFELNNLKRGEKISEIWKKQCAITKDDFVLSLEKVEYESTLDMFNVFNQCIDGKFWSKQNHEYRLLCRHFDESSSESWHTFEGFFKSLEMNKHTDVYRNDWLQKCKRSEKTS